MAISTGLTPERTRYRMNVQKTSTVREQCSSGISAAAQPSARMRYQNLSSSGFHPEAVSRDSFVERVHVREGESSKPTVWHQFTADPHEREQALSYSKQRARYGRAEIQLLDESGNVAETIGNEDSRPLV